MADPEELHKPRPVRRDDPRGDAYRRAALVIMTLDVPDCKCHMRMPRVCMQGQVGYPQQCPGERRCADCHCPPCQHVLATDHDVSLEDWAALLHAYDPDGYAEPAMLGERSYAVTVEARVDALHERARLGLRLFHPMDLFNKGKRAVRDPDGEDDRVLVLGDKGLRQRGVAVVGTPSAAEDEVPAPAPALPENADRVTLRAIGFEEAAARAARALRRDRT